MKKFVEIFLVAVVLCIPASITTAQQIKAEQLYQQALYEMEGKGDYAKAIESFNLIITKFPKEKVTAAKALLNIGRCYEKFGKSEAVKAYERIINEYKDQTQVVAEARTRIALLKQSTEDVVRQSNISNRQIWAGKDVDTEGAPSPDGQYLSYSHNGSLAIYNVKTGKRIILGNPGSNRHMGVNESVWSPDGKQLAYGLIDEDHGIAEIQLVNVDGAIHRKLCSADTGSSYIWVEDWSKDGKMILAVFQNSDGSDSKIALVSVVDGSVRFVKNMKNWNWSLSRKLFFSPDGRFIAYSSPTEKKSKSCDVFVIAIDGTVEINITQHPDDDRVLSWDPNGSRLLFASNRGGGYSIWSIQIVNGKPQEYPKLVKDNIGKISPMGLTNDGSLYYSITSAEVTNFSSRESNIYLASINPQTGKILSPPVPATMQNNGFNHSLTWSPDGKKLLFYSAFWENSSNHWNKTFIFSPEKGLEKNVVPQIMSDTVTAYNWFPDGKHLAVMARLKDGSSSGIYNFEIQTGKMVPLLISNKDTAYAFPSVSPDGKTIFTHTFVPNNQSIYSYDIEKKERKLLFQSGTDRYIYSVRLSSDGKQLAFILMTIRPDEFPALMVMPSSGGEATAIYRNKITGQYGNFAWYYGLDWSPDGQYIYFAKRPDSVSPYELLRIPVQGGTLEQTGLVMEGLHSISIRPDGKQIAFSAGKEPTKAIWVLENIFADARTQLTTVAGLVTRRVLTDASNIQGTVSADGKFIRSLDWNTGDVVQYEVSRGETSRIKNIIPWGKNNNALRAQVFSRDGKKIVYNVEIFDSTTQNWLYQLRIRNLDGSDLRAFYSTKDFMVYPLDLSPDASSILSFLEGEKESELALLSTIDGKLKTLKIMSYPMGWLKASFSSDGKFIAFCSVSEGSRDHGEVHLMATDGKNDVVIAEHSAENRLLGWSPDGRRLIFLSDRSGTWDIWSVKISEGKQEDEPELLKKDFGYYSEVLGFAADGSCYYKTEIPQGGLYNGEIDIETGKVLVKPTQVATRYIGPPMQLTWSPDGKNLAYISRWGWGPGKDILTIRSKTTEEERLLSGLGFINQISWTHDSRSITAIGDSGSVRIDIETSKIYRLADMGLFPRLCPDGKTLIFANGQIIWKQNLETGEKSEVVNVGKGGTAQMNYDLSPDGREVVFQKDSVVNIVSLNGGIPHEIFQHTSIGNLYRLKWTLDGRYIIVRIVDATQTSTTEIWRVSAKGGTPIKLELPISKIGFFALHPDSRHFALTVNEGTKSELWVMENFLPKEKK